MSMACLKRWRSKGETANQKPHLELVGREGLSPEELESFRKVLDQYAGGDMHTRLSLYLYHRDLRDTFEMLDRIG